MKRGRPKGHVNLKTSKRKASTAVGNLIRSRRVELGLGLAEVAKRCACSLQFISNVEHGRATLPWNRVPHFAQALKLARGKLQAANLSGRSDFKQAMKSDSSLVEVIRRYQIANAITKKKFVQTALKILTLQN